MPNVGATLGGGRDEDVNPGFGVKETQTTGEGQVAVSYDVDLFGRLAASTASAKASLLATEAARDNVRLAIVAAGKIL